MTVDTSYLPQGFKEAILFSGLLLTKVTISGQLVAITGLLVSIKLI